jgi:hypothetical protein
MLAEIWIPGAVEVKFGVSKGTKKLHKCRKLEPSQANPNAVSNTLLSRETCMVRYETFDAGTFSNDVQHFCKFNDIRYTCSARGLSFAQAIESFNLCVLRWPRASLSLTSCMLTECRDERKVAHI